MKTEVGGRQGSRKRLWRELELGPRPGAKIAASAVAPHSALPQRILIGTDRFRRSLQTDNCNDFSSFLTFREKLKTHRDEVSVSRSG